MPFNVFGHIACMFSWNFCAAVVYIAKRAIRCTVIREIVFYWMHFCYRCNKILHMGNGKGTMQFGVEEKTRI